MSKPVKLDPAHTGLPRTDRNRGIGLLDRIREWVRTHPKSVVVGILGLCVLLAAYRIYQWNRNPNVYLLVDESNAKWIRPFNAFNLGTHDYLRPMGTMFRCEFTLSQPVSRATLRLTAFRTMVVWVDADPKWTQPLFESGDDFSRWKTPAVLELPGTLEKGKHELSVFVTNQAAHTCLLASSPELGIASGTDWDTIEVGQSLMKAVLASDGTTTVPNQIKEAGDPDMFESLSQKWPWLLVIFVAVSTWTWISDAGRKIGRAPSTARLTPRRLRWMLMVAWVIMGVNNLWKVPPEIGFDVNDHVDYVKFLLKEHRIPLASDGWQMFQSPLLYLMAAPVYAVCSTVLSPPDCVEFLRIFPLLCGLAQIEILYRTAMVVFPDRDDLQSISISVGALMPMNIYMSNAFGNEPLVGCLTAVLVLLCVKLLRTPSSSRHRHYFVWMGIVWGLALLSKVTPLLLAPLLVSLIFYQSWIVEGSFASGVRRNVSMFASCFVVTGWYYVRNWILLERPFVGGWDPTRGISWWQDPSYRTWSQLLSFGASLKQPLYAGVMSFWDAIYSTMWADGFLSGNFVRIPRNPWNIAWMEVAALLSIVPVVCILAGLITMWMKRNAAACGSLIVAASAIGIYFAAIIDLYVQIPIFSSAKSSYALGLLPCFGILAAAGAEPLLHLRILRSVMVGALSCWATSSFFAFFCLKSLG